MRQNTDIRVIRISSFTMKNKAAFFEVPKPDRQAPLSSERRAPGGVPDPGREQTADRPVCLRAKKLESQRGIC